jgi:hypothetical protein
MGVGCAAAWHTQPARTPYDASHLLLVVSICLADGHLLVVHCKMTTSASATCTSSRATTVILLSAHHPASQQRLEAHPAARAGGARSSRPPSPAGGSGRHSSRHCCKGTHHGVLEPIIMDVHTNTTAGPRPLLDIQTCRCPLVKRPIHRKTAAMKLLQSHQARPGMIPATLQAALQFAQQEIERLLTTVWQNPGKTSLCVLVIIPVAKNQIVFKISFFWFTFPDFLDASKSAGGQICLLCLPHRNQGRGGAHRLGVHIAVCHQSTQMSDIEATKLAGSCGMNLACGDHTTQCCEDLGIRARVWAQAGAYCTGCAWSCTPRHSDGE